MGLTQNLGRLSPAITSDASLNLICQASLKSVGRIFSTSDANYGDLVSTTGALVLSFDATGQQGYLTSRNYATSTDKPLNYNGSKHIFNGGNVGIGTSTPYSALQVNGNVHRQFSTAGTTGSPASEEGFVYSEQSNANALAGMWFENNFQSASGVSVVFKYRTNGGTVTEGMRIKNSGTVLIGTTSDDGNKFQVSGGISAVGVGAGLYFQNRPSSNYFTWYGVTNVLLFNSDIGNIGQFAYSNGAYTALSDINKKKDFEQSEIGLNAILGLKPTLFRMKTDNEDVEKTLGFIAQEVKEFIPQAYVESGEGEDKFIGLTDRPIIAALVKAIQEQQQQIEELKQLINK